MKKSCLIIAGEKSGEEHCETFYPELISAFPHCDFFGVGGDLMIKRGFRTLFHLKEFSSWGISEVVLRIPFYFNALKKIESEVERTGCQVAILIDFQTFNLKLATKLSAKGVKVLYYVAPQAWAWKAWRAQVLAKTVDTLFTILPFEKEWFLARGVKQVHSINHPLLRSYQDRLNHFNRVVTHFEREGGIKRIVLLPGSRNFEVRNLLPEFLAAIEILKKEFRIEVGVVTTSSVENRIYLPYLNRIEKQFKSEDLADALLWADVALAASGTVTLTCALFQLPTVVAYKTSILNEFIYENFISYKGPISLANILHQAPALFPELVQNGCSGFNIAKIVKCWLTDRPLYEKIISQLKLTADFSKGSDGPEVKKMIEVLSSSGGVV